MSKINVKKITLFIVALIGAMMILPALEDLYSIKHKDFYVPLTPQDESFQSTTIYLIDPGTILQSLHDGHTDVFTPATPDTEPSISSKLPSNSFIWKQEDYLSIANAVHEYKWKESLEKWQLYSMRFTIDRCYSVEEGIDLAELTYYQRQGNRYIVHGMRINPLMRKVTTGDSQYPYRKEWTPIDINTLAVKTPDEALKLAESNGGRDARGELDGNGCSIDLYLKPDAFVFSLFSNPFKLYGLGWGVQYWNNSENDFLFRDSIDAYSGK